MVEYILLLILIVTGFSESDADLYAERMSRHYGRQLSYQMRYFPNKWYATTLYANGSCTSTVYLSDQFEGNLGSDDLWKGVLAHEWAHVIQGKACVNNERGADIIALNKLIEAGEISAFFTYSEFLKDRWNWTQDEIYGAIGR